MQDMREGKLPKPDITELFENEWFTDNLYTRF
jgi:hypothetical protein